MNYHQRQKLELDILRASVKPAEKRRVVSYEPSFTFHFMKLKSVGLIKVK